MFRIPFCWGWKVHVFGDTSSGLSICLQNNLIYMAGEALSEKITPKQRFETRRMTEEYLGKRWGGGVEQAFQEELQARVNAWPSERTGYLGESERRLEQNMRRNKRWRRKGWGGRHLQGRRRSVAKPGLCLRSSKRSKWRVGVWQGRAYILKSSLGLACGEELEEDVNAGLR